MLHPTQNAALPALQHLAIGLLWHSREAQTALPFTDKPGEIRSKNFHNFKLLLRKDHPCIFYLIILHAAREMASKSVSIYDLRPRTLQNRILLCAATISVLTPVTDTIILPALISVSTLPGSTADTSAAIISAYMGALGVFNLFWGPLSDRFGRRRPLLLTLVLYLGVTIACIFAPSAASLLGLRAAQGAVTGATVSVTQASERRLTRRLGRGGLTAASIPAYRGLWLMCLHPASAVLPWVSTSSLYLSAPS